MRIELFTRVALRAALMLCLGSGQAFAHGENESPAGTASVAAIAPLANSPVAVAAQFASALRGGDAAMVRALLSPDVLIFESGGAELSLEEYAGHHMPADIAFLANLESEQLMQGSGGDETSAWVATRTRLRGRFDNKNLDLDSTETLTLSKTTGRWRIVHVHWSSAPHRQAVP